MITLTQRLHERDESIIHLQSELDARDQRISDLQERLERQVRPKLHSGYSTATASFAQLWSVKHYRLLP